jgi:membrane associated rhomboid family serine protease
VTQIRAWWRSQRSPRRPWYDPSTSSGAMLAMTAVAALLWAVQIANAADDYGLDRFGLKPRRLDGLWGIITQPFLHANWTHLLSNTAPVVLIGWVLMRSGVRMWAIVTAIVVTVGGLATWVVGPSHTVIVGASGMVFGWLGYLLARAYFARKLSWILEAILVLFFFGTLLYGLLPTLHSRVSWQAHLCGFLAGVGAGAVLHPVSRKV